MVLQLHLWAEEGQAVAAAAVAVVPVAVLPEAAQVAERKQGFVLGAAMKREKSLLLELNCLSRSKPKVGTIEHKRLLGPPFELPLMIFCPAFICHTSILKTSLLVRTLASTEPTP
jgi:hypothetical protein